MPVGPVLGICNGFQVLTRAGLLPGALGHNAGGHFDCRWVTLAANPASAASGRRHVAGTIHCPIAHGEGRYVHPRPRCAAARGQVVVRYAAATPTGRVADIAGVCDETGLVLGLMPHPENHVVRPPAPAPPSRRRRRPARSGIGLFRSAVAPCQPDGRTDATPFVEIDLPLADRREGKVRVSYRLAADEPTRLFVTTDRLSAFDRNIAGIPYKGQVLNQLAAWWFARTAGIVANHVIAVPDPNVLIARATTPLPVEVVVRGAITGVTSTSLWQLYADGARTIYGYHFPDGLRKNTLLPEPIVTPTTKPAAGSGAHDEPLTGPRSSSAASSPGRAGSGYDRSPSTLFTEGQRIAAEAGLILADTKYEFGVTADDEVLLIDEVHTPDSSRYWVADSYEQRLAAGDEPESLDKEVVRRALADVGYRGDGEPPALGADVIAATTDRYIGAYERLTGERFEPGDYPVGQTHRRPARRDPERGSRAPMTRKSRRHRALDDDSPHDECGVLGLSTPSGDGVAQLAFFGLFALQHRGQEGAGLAVSDGRRVRVHKQPGLVSNVFTREALAPLVGYHAIGHTRYSTTGGEQRSQHPAVRRRDDARPAGAGPQRQHRQHGRACATSCCRAASG